MTDALRPPWSQRSSAWCLLGMTFLLGLRAGLMLASHVAFVRQTEAHAHLSQEAQAVIAERASRPSVQERFDQLDAWLRAIEQRVSACVKETP